MRQRPRRDPARLRAAPEAQGSHRRWIESYWNRRGRSGEEPDPRLLVGAERQVLDGRPTRRPDRLPEPLRHHQHVVDDGFIEIRQIG